MEDNLNNFYVYEHKNKINGKRYIGITKQKPETRWGKDGNRYSKSSPVFWCAIKKYGWNNFEHNILYSNISQDTACQIEKDLIKKYNTTDREYGYNMTSGGDKHYIFTDDVKKKLSEQKMGDNNPSFGTHLTDEEKEYLSKVQRKIVEEGGQHAKKVRCIETDIIYYSCKDAARQTGSGNEKQCTHIADVCNKKRNKCNGYTWEWYNDINS